MKISIKLVTTAALIAFALAGAVLPGCSSLGTKPTDEEKRRFETSPHYDREQGVFVNRDRLAYERMQKRDKFDDGMFKFMFGNENNEKPETGLPVLKPEVKEFLAPSDEIKVIWFGHSTLLVNLQGTIILIDPILSGYASPVFFAIRRFQDPPLQLQDLPRIDYILISHDHYDHLDRKTIRFFRDKTNRFIVPLGVGSHMKGWGIDPSRIDEFDWWQSRKYGELEFVATPAQHFSGRSFNDRNQTLWASWVIKNNEKRIYYSGDSGYDTHFKAIGDKYGPFDIAFIENGQYNKNWEEVHVFPEQGVQAFYELRGKVFFPIHWGAFKLSVHSWYEPIEKIHQFSLNRKFPLIAPKIGEIVTVSENFPLETWWKPLIEK